MEALPGVLGIQGEGLFIFRDFVRRVIYFQGFGEKAYIYIYIYIFFFFFFFFFFGGGGGGREQGAGG